MHKKYTKDEIEQFWVGLIDSDGSVQCNHWRKRVLQYRIVIKMDRKNLDMLLTIQKHLGGSVRSYDKSCIWVEDHQRRIWKLCEIFERYPPLTTRVLSQVTFLKQCAVHKSVHWMLENRNKKYSNRGHFLHFLKDTLHFLDFADSPRIEIDSISEESIVSILKLPYFSLWLTGFIEGEGCFCVRENGNKSFSISQKYDFYLLEVIRYYFEGKNKVRFLKNEIFVWEVYRKESLQKIVDHCDQFPLLGYKKTQFDCFKTNFLESS